MANPNRMFSNMLQAAVTVGGLILDELQNGI